MKTQQCLNCHTSIGFCNCTNPTPELVAPDSSDCDTCEDETPCNDCTDCGQDPCICGINDVSMEKPKFPCWVNVYLICLCDGGPEEGGWTYTAGSVEEAVQVDNQEQLSFVLKMFRDRYELDEKNVYLYKDQYDHPNFDRERNRDLSSVLSWGDYNIYVQPTKGENYPKEKPHYC